VYQDQSLEALHDDGCECYRAVVVEARRVGMFWQWYNGCGFKGCWHSCLGKGQVENVREDPSELLCTCPKHASKDVIWSSSLVCVDPAQCCMDISGGECEGLVVCRGCRLGGGVAVVSLKVSIKVV